MKAILNFIWGLLLLPFVVSSAPADIKHEYIQRQLMKQMEELQPLEVRLEISAARAAVQGGTIDQKLDHNNEKDERTFKQRYFLNSTYAENSESPVLYYICGESVCDEGQISRSTLLAFARELKAHLVTLEHRYYGLSQPFTTLTAENLRYLSTDFALRDLAAFQGYAMKNLGLRGKWIAVGGSYAGSLAAYYRMRFPQNVVGSLSSSGPVQARAKFEEYDRHIAKVAGTECSSQIRQVVQEIESTLDTPTKFNDVKSLFDAEEVRNPVDFLYIVADIAAFAIQYGFNTQFCNALKTETSIASYAAVGKRLLANFGMTPVMISFQSAENLDPMANQDFAMRQWMYQSCTEYGYYQVAYHDSAISTRSSRIDLDYHNSVCERLFGIKKPVDDQATNREYYEPLLHEMVTNIFFTNGTNDPWTNLSITEELGNNVNPNLTLMSIEGAAHCDDLSSGSRPMVVAARQRFLSLAREWLQKAAGSH